MKQIASPSLMHDNGCLRLVSGYWCTGMTQMVQGGRREGGVVWDGEHLWWIHIDV